MYRCSQYQQNGFSGFGKIGFWEMGKIKKPKKIQPISFAKDSNRSPKIAQILFSVAFENLNPALHSWPSR